MSEFIGTHDVIADSDTTDITPKPGYQHRDCKRTTEATSRLAYKRVSNQAWGTPRLDMTASSSILATIPGNAPVRHSKNAVKATPATARHDQPMRRQPEGRNALALRRTPSRVSCACSAVCIAVVDNKALSTQPASHTACHSLGTVSGDRSCCRQAPTAPSRGSCRAGESWWRG